jgi:hypothetical protein
MTWRRSTELSCLCVKPVWWTKTQYLNEILSKTDKTWTWCNCCIIVSSLICWEMGHVKKAGPGFVNDVTAWWPSFVLKKFTNKQEPKQHINHSFNTFRSIQCEQFKEKLSEIRGCGQADRHFAAHYCLFLN